MKTPMIALAAMLAATLAVPVNVLAGPDTLQRMLLDRMAQAKKKQEEAEKAKGTDRQKLMQEHMRMMEQNMKEMQAMRPHKGMSMKEHEEWIAQHQKIMDQMLEQMVKDQKMLMETEK
jgi:hypothetical protein